MDNRLVLIKIASDGDVLSVLILIVMDNRLVLIQRVLSCLLIICLNPYCNGQPTSTFYATAGQYIIMES